MPTPFLTTSSEFLNTALREAPRNGILCVYVQDYISLSELYADRASGAATPEVVETASGGEEEASLHDVMHTHEILATELTLQRVIALLDSYSDN